MVIGRVPQDILLSSNPTSPLPLLLRNHPTQPSKSTLSPAAHTSIPTTQPNLPTYPSNSINPKALLVVVIFFSYSLLKMFINHSELLPSNHAHHHSSHPLEPLDLSSVSGFFIQDQLDQEPHQFQIYHPNSSFGLIDPHPSDRWIRFQDQISHLQRSSSSDLKYKVIFIARHGQGFHNLAESKYGTPLWDCYWSQKMTDGELVWGPDAMLSDLGKDEARRAETAWTRELDNHAPVPEIFIVSPLSRAIETMVITGAWKHSTHESENNQKSPSRILVTEKWRENIGLHTCDLRRSKQEISIDFPIVEFENGFSDQDLLWTKDVQETDKQLDIRIKEALTRLFLDPTSSNLTYISITAHSGVISSLLRVLGHRPWPIETGGMIPLVVRATPQKTPTRPPEPGPSATKPPCPKSWKDF